MVIHGPWIPPKGSCTIQLACDSSDADLLWVRTFDTIEELRAALVEFPIRYNETLVVARHIKVSPPDRL